jgi:diketogulonate reductase-like aldo/keto reductase
MFTKELGKTGFLIPEIGMGTWNYHAGPAPLRRGLEAGALFIDTAESYGSEPLLAQAIRGLRQQVFLATKVSPQNFRPTDLRRSVDSSLQRLGVDVIDLLQLHGPNPAVPIQETIGSLSDLADAGKIRFLGVSNFSVAQLQAAQTASAKHPIVSNQVRYNIIDRTIEESLLPYCQALGITVIAYSPLARGLNRIRDCDPRGCLAEVAHTTGKSSAQVVLNWCLCKDGVVAIPKGNSEEHVLENCGASGWRLTAEQIALLDANILYRRRTRFDHWVRKSTPDWLREAALAALTRLPQSLRRRIT